MAKWTDAQVGRALKTLAREPNVLPWSERVWDRIESRLARRRPAAAWRPWSLPARLGLAGAGFAAVLCGLLVYQNSAGQAELASYLLKASDERIAVPEDLGFVKIPVLLSAPSSQALQRAAVPVLLGDEEPAGLEDAGFSGGEDDILSPI
ncbi:MAG TPA: hypothetical protein VFR02_01055 [bacterium]|nr:hypothetical protein [bacterium]